MSARGETAQAILGAIRAGTAANGYPPSIRELADAVGLRSTHTVDYHLKALKREGLIEMEPGKNRSIRIKARVCCPHCGK